LLLSCTLISLLVLRRFLFAASMQIPIFSSAPHESLVSGVEGMGGHSGLKAKPEKV
jgi:hypothetical protein